MKKIFAFTFLSVTSILAANSYCWGCQNSGYQDGYYYPQQYSGQYSNSMNYSQPYYQDQYYSQTQPVNYSGYQSSQPSMGNYQYSNQAYGHNQYPYYNENGTSSNMGGYSGFRNQSYGTSQYNNPSSGYNSEYGNSNMYRDNLNNQNYSGYNNQNTRASQAVSYNSENSQWSLNDSTRATQTPMSNDMMRNTNSEPYQRNYQPSSTDPYSGKNFSYNDSSYNNSMMMNNGMGSSGMSANDQELTKKVGEVVHSGWFSKPYKNVNFSVMNGVVTLRGDVASAEEKKNLEDSVRKVDGVQQINNQVMVIEKNTNYDNSAELKNEQNYPQDQAATESDRLLNSKIRDKISNGWFTRENKTLVIRTNNGVVTITGFVEKYEDLDKLNNELRKVEGIRAVNNQVQVNPNQNR